MNPDKPPIDKNQPMLHNTQSLYGRTLSATDGEIGHVQDFYFDDQTWAARYLVVDTGTWLTGRKVLLPSDAFGDDPFPDSEHKLNDLRQASPVQFHKSD
jgi:hypothetical protein